MKFIFYSPVAFEKWDWRNSVEKGIGGSETSHVEMSWRLAARGHEVITYAPIPDDCPGEWRGTKWYPIEKADFTQKGIWILYRCPDVVDKFPSIGRRKDQKLWLMMQDWDYPNWTDKHIKNTDLIITLCKSHGADVVTKHPLIKNNLWLTSNGLKPELIEKIEKENIERNPYKIMYASSPDRGLKQAILSFRKARKIIPELELHAFYGFNNLDKLTKMNPKSMLAKTAQEIKDLMETDGVIFHGRVSQEDLYRQWFSAGIWIYETNFNETSCITSMEAQACGAVPIFSPVYAQRENIKNGIAIEGNADDPLTHARFAAELVRLAVTPDMQENIRKTMMPWARERFNWENFVTQWEDKGEGKEYTRDFPEQLDYENL